MTLQSIDSPKENRILAALSADEFQRLLPMLEFVHIELGLVIYGSGDKQGYVYFPTTAIVSLVFTTENGSSAELAIIGNDGLVGIPVILGGGSTTHHATVQSAGNAYRLRSEYVCQEFDLGKGLQSLALRYAQALMAQMAQSVVCNRHHSVDKQLCRWLLLSLDRLPGNQVRMTHELIANMLGVRREGVTEAAGKLQMAGLIRYSRGLITVIDRPGLEARVCECYAVIKKELDRLFSLPMEAHHTTHLQLPHETLRQRAEQHLQDTGASPLRPTDQASLLHELQVHQIELEMQLDELHAAYDRADALSDRYADIYDFAPVGYFTLDAEAHILDLNLAGAILLGIKRSEKDRHQFDTFVSPEYLPEFKHFLAHVLKAKSKKICEITLLLNARRAEASVRIEAVPDEEGGECRMVIIDISAENQVKQLQAEREKYLRALLDKLPGIVWQPGDEQDILKCSMINAIPMEIVVIDQQGTMLMTNEHWQHFALKNGVDPGIPAAQTEIGSNYLSVCQTAVELASPGAQEAYQGILSVLHGELPGFSIEYLCPTADQPRYFLMNVIPLGATSGEGAVITHTDITERKRVEQRLRQQVLHDEVTRLPNRLLLNDRLSHAMASNKRNGSLGALIYLGLGHDTPHISPLGQAQIDSLMTQIAHRLQSCVRTTDTVARTGELEFVVIIDKLLTSRTESSFEAGCIAEKICRSFAEPFQLPLTDQGGKTYAHPCTVSAGVNLFTDQEDNPETILQAACTAMQLARETGNNQVRFHEAEAGKSPDSRCFRENMTCQTVHIPAER